MAAAELPGLQKAAALLKEARTVGMACHVGPDGDALGSMLGMAVAASTAGKTVFPSFGEPFVIPTAYRFLPTDLLVPPTRVPDDTDVFVTFDAGSIDRLADLARKASSAGSLVVIDHHVTNAGFGDVDLIDPQAAATGEVVVRLLDALGWDIDPVAATCLHTALVTDTGRFQYSNTTPETLRTAARLVTAGARPDVVSRHVYEEVPFGYLHVAADVLGRARLEPERRLVWSVVTLDDLTRAGIHLDDTDPLIDTLRLAREADVALLLKKLEGSRIKVSLRSRGRVDVGAIATAMGGGGHHNAAGATVEGSVDEVVAGVRTALEPIGPIEEWSG